MGKKTKPEDDSNSESAELARSLRILLNNARLQLALLVKLTESINAKASNSAITFSPAATATTSDVTPATIDEAIADDGNAVGTTDLFGGTQYRLEVLRDLSPKYYAREIEPRIGSSNSTLNPPNAPRKTPAKKKAGSSVPLVRTLRSRMDDYHRGRVVCDDCGKRGSGSRSQSGITYYYCRNSHCKGKGASSDRFIGWTQTILEPALDGEVTTAPAAEAP